jgi:predicted RecA/RadA family phage recombinase
MSQAEFWQNGDRVTYTAGADLAVGDVVPLVGRCGVVLNKVANGSDTTLLLTGVFKVTAENDTAWSQGDTVYWDDTNNKSTKTSSGNTKLGVAHLAKAQTAAVGYVHIGK